MTTQTDLEILIRELDELVEQEEAAKAAVRSLRMKRGMKAKRVRTVAAQLEVSVLEVREAMGPAPVAVVFESREDYVVRRAPEIIAERDDIDPAHPSAAPTSEAIARIEWNEAHPDWVEPVTGHACPDCDGAGGDPLCSCYGTGWID